MRVGAEARPSLWCAGPIIAAVQSARIFNDSKDFVDAALLVPPAEAWRRWDALPQPVPPDALREFVNTTFAPPGSGLVAWEPTDWRADPDLLRTLPAGPLRDWARAMHAMWLQLGREPSGDARRWPERTTLIPAARPFVVPGGRFREGYYWDSYWIVLGLLASGMRQTAHNIIANLLDCVARHGYVPNGMRTYYSGRSQPPMLTQMVSALLDDADDADLLSAALPLLDQEYGWWMRHGGHSAVRMPEAGGGGVLNRYVVASASGPRPESWAEDVAVAAALGADEAAEIFAEIAAAAESGWDFSSRWFVGEGAEEGGHVDGHGDGGGHAGGGGDMEGSAALRRTATSQIAPVDLNAILYRNEITLAELHARADGGGGGGGGGGGARALARSGGGLRRVWRRLASAVTRARARRRRASPRRRPPRRRPSSAAAARRGGARARRARWGGGDGPRTRRRPRPRRRRPQPRLELRRRVDVESLEQLVQPELERLVDARLEGVLVLVLVAEASVGRVLHLPLPRRHRLAQLAQRLLEVGEREAARADPTPGERLDVEEGVVDLVDALVAQIVCGWGGHTDVSRARRAAPRRMGWELAGRTRAHLRGRMRRRS